MLLQESAICSYTLPRLSNPVYDAEIQLEVNVVIVIHTFIKALLYLYGQLATKDVSSHII